MEIKIIYSINKVASKDTILSSRTGNYLHICVGRANSNVYHRQRRHLMMDSNMRKVDRNNRVYCNLCKSGLSISADSDLWLHDGIWHRKNSIDYFIKYARAD